MKRPNVVLYTILGFLVKIFSWCKGQRIILKEKIKGPAIVLSNHTSFYDFIYTTSAVYPHRVSYLVADKMMVHPILGFFLRKARAIPKCLFQADPVATLNVFRLLRKNGIIGIFPEGQISPIGKTAKPTFSIAKLLKKAKVDVYVVLHKNAYLVNPPWTKRTFAGRIETSMERIFSTSELESLSEKEIYNRVIEKLEYNVSSFNETQQYRYNINHIEGLEAVIYTCPSCFKKEMKTYKNKLVCPSCQKELVFDHMGKIGEYRLDYLYEQQVHDMERRILQEPNFILTGAVTLESYRNKKLVVVGQGVLSLTKEYYLYRGTVDEEICDLLFETKNVPTLPSDIGINIQIYQGYQIFQFVFEDYQLPTQFVIAGELLYLRSTTLDNR
jgi:1-acyl-sn-glycerol-3-phosphate acyltransferase